MDNLLTIAFEAHHAELNHHRRYEITVGRDLLDDWTVCIRYGRIGQAGREQRFASASDEESKAVVRNRLRRRVSALKRIGCRYGLTSLSTADGFEAATWLPAGLMARLARDEAAIA